MNEDLLKTEAASMTTPEILENFDRSEWDRSKEILAEDLVERFENVLELVQDANDSLEEAVDWANRSAEHGEMRPSTHIAFKNMTEATRTLIDADPTREHVDECS